MSLGTLQSAHMQTVSTASTEYRLALIVTNRPCVHSKVSCRCLHCRRVRDTHTPTQLPHTVYIPSSTLQQNINTMHVTHTHTHTHTEGERRRGRERGRERGVAPPLKVVCLVTGLPASSIILSALPWSAVMRRTQLVSSHALWISPMAASEERERERESGVCVCGVCAHLLCKLLKYCVTFARTVYICDTL